MRGETGPSGEPGKGPRTKAPPGGGAARARGAPAEAQAAVPGPRGAQGRRRVSLETWLGTQIIARPVAFTLNETRSSWGVGARGSGLC